MPIFRFTLKEPFLLPSLLYEGKINMNDEWQFSHLFKATFSKMCERKKLE